MAERIQVELVDDIDGSPAQHSITFALDGVTYEIDLSDRHAQQLREVFHRYIPRARNAEADTGKSSRQQQDDQRTRHANQQLTEQIRGAAQRTREHLNKQATDDGANGESAPRDDRQGDEPDTLALSLPEPESRESGGESDSDDRVASVSLPHFSSAVE